MRGDIVDRANHRGGVKLGEREGVEVKKMGERDR
jgi:hypothetical protein